MFDRDLAALDRRCSALRWRDRLPLILTIALAGIIPMALMERLLVRDFDPARFARNRDKIRPIFTPLPRHESNGTVTLWITLNADGSVNHLENHDPSEDASLYGVAAAAATRWRFDTGGTTVKIVFLFRDGDTRATWEVDE
jgi:hypothetical protein